VPKRIAREFGFAPPIVIRSGRELAQVVKASPYPVPEQEGHSLHVLFLADKPAAQHIRALDPNRSPGDSYAVLGGEIYLALTNSAADTKLTNAYFDSKLGTISTGRNWRTVLKLLELTSD
jgi:uncharacterized protein (DUF1697 family)